jgi:hypothetical protein
LSEIPPELELDELLLELEELLLELDELELEELLELDELDELDELLELDELVVVGGFEPPQPTSAPTINVVNTAPRGRAIASLFGLTENICWLPLSLYFYDLETSTPPHLHPSGRIDREYHIMNVRNCETIHIDPSVAHGNSCYLSRFCCVF